MKKNTRRRRKKPQAVETDPERREELLEEHRHQRARIHQMDEMMVRLIIDFMSARIIPIARVHEIKCNLGKPIRDKRFENQKITRIRRIAKEHGLPETFFDAFLRKLFMYSARNQNRWRGHGFFAKRNVDKVFRSESGSHVD